MIEIIQMDLGTASELTGLDMLPIHPTLLQVEGEIGVLAVDLKEGTVRAFREITPEEAAAGNAEILDFEPSEAELPEAEPPAEAGAATAADAPSDGGLPDTDRSPALDLVDRVEGAGLSFALLDFVEAPWILDGRDEQPTRSPLAEVFRLSLR